MPYKETNQYFTMNKKWIVALLAFGPLLLTAQQKVSIIPQPVSMQVNAGSFTLDANTAINFNASSKELKAAAVFLSEYIKNSCGYTLPVTGVKSKSIQLVLSAIEDIGAEGYQLNVSANTITIKANTKAGIVYGMQTLFQTMPQVRTNAVVQIPCMQVTDYPRFKWRGMHLDVSRHFFSPDMVKEFINLMAAYKMNTFHWHLTDDPGWRIEIKKYPLLTSVGAWRVEDRDKGWGGVPQAQPGEPATYGGFYTQEQIKDIVQFAADRNITIVPEIEMPGHSAAAIAAYAALSCSQHPQLPMVAGNYNNISSNYCAGNDSVFTFLENVLTEVMNLFPSKYIHVGGDEVDKTDWKKCARCQARIKREGLKNEEELQSYFMKRIEKFIVSKQKKMIGWDEILEGGLAPEATVMSWRGERGGIEAAKMNHDVIMTPGYPCYFDHYQAGPEGEPLAFGGFNTVKAVYEYEPVPKELNEAQAKRILGSQGNVWTEYITTPAYLEYMVLPRMPALAEVLWTPAKERNWDSFNERIQVLFKGYDQKGIHYSPGNFTVYIKPVSQNGKLFVSLLSEALNPEIYYTTDGSIPTPQSNKYVQPIAVDASVTIKAVAVVKGKVMGLRPAEQTFVLHKAIGKAVVYTNPVNKNYLADGPNSLTDGVRGTIAVGKYWHGFEGKDLIATIDLGEAQSIKTISIGCYQNYRSWIFLPSAVTFEVSTDGVNFTTLQTVENKLSVNETNATIYNFTTNFAEQKVKFIRVSAKNIGVCPKGHGGEGLPAWLFADEIMVN